jgi:hypothetical protein
MKRGLVVAMAMQGALACSPASIASAPADAGVLASIDGGDGGITIARSCADVAFSRCNALHICSDAALEIRFGDLRTCEAIFEGSCLNIVSAPGSGQTIAGAEACAADLVQPNPKWQCSDYLFAQNPTPNCQLPTGSLTDGAACALPQQCKSGFCSVANGKMCGTCAPPIAVGASCAGLSACPRQYVCNAPTQKCVGFANMGAACSPGQPCAAHLQCVGYNPQSGAPGTCEQAASMAGGSCSFQGAGCDVLDGLSCNAQTQLCATAQIQMPGEACGVVGNQQAYCYGGGDCVDGACRAAGLPGDRCDIVNGPSCITLANCIVDADSGTSGTCQLSNASACK